MEIKFKIPFGHEPSVLYREAIETLTGLPCRLDAFRREITVLQGGSEQGREGVARILGELGLRPIETVEASRHGIENLTHEVLKLLGVH